MNQALQDRLRIGLNILFGITQLVANGLGSTGALSAGRDVGQMSDMYANSFVPADFTFAVWGAIYTGITAYAVYQAVPNQHTREIHRRVGPWAILAAVTNTAWTPVFVNNWIPASLVIIVVMLFALAAIFNVLRQMRGELTTADRVLVAVPFGGYFAWINIATVANATTALIFFDWSGLGVADPVWSVIAIAAATTITSLMILFSGGNTATYPFLAVLLWALGGVYAGQAADSQLVGWAAIVAGGILVAVTAYRFASRRSVESGSQAPAAA